MQRSARTASETSVAPTHDVEAGPSLRVTQRSARRHRAGQTRGVGHYGWLLSSLLASACAEQPAYELSWTLIEAHQIESATPNPPALQSAFDCSSRGVVRIRVETVYGGDHPSAGKLAHAAEYPCFPEEFQHSSDPEVVRERRELRALLGIDEDGNKVPEEELYENPYADEDEEPAERRERERRLKDRLELLNGLDGRVRGPELEPGEYDVVVYGLDRRNQRWKTWTGNEGTPFDACAPTQPASEDDADDAGASSDAATDQERSSLNSDDLILCDTVKLTVPEQNSEAVELPPFVLRAPHQCEDGIDNDDDGASDRYDPGCSRYDGDPFQDGVREGSIIESTRMQLDIAVLGANRCNDGDEPSFGAALDTMLLTVQPMPLDAGVQCPELPPHISDLAPATACDPVTQTLAGQPDVRCEIITCADLSRDFNDLLPDSGCVSASLTGIDKPGSVANSEAAAVQPLTRRISLTRKLEVVRPTAFEFAFGFPELLPALQDKWSNQFTISTESFTGALDGDNQSIILSDYDGSTACELSNVLTTARIRLRAIDGSPDPGHGSQVLLEALTDPAAATMTDEHWLEFPCSTQAAFKPLVKGFVWTDFVRIEAESVVRHIPSDTAATCTTGNYPASSTPGQVATSFELRPDQALDIQLRRLRATPSMNNPDPLLCRECETDPDCTESRSCDVASGKCVSK